MKHLKKLLKNLGLNDEAIDKFVKEGLSDDADFDISKMQESVLAHSRKMLENDQEFINTIKGQEKGRQLDIVTHAIKKQFDLSADEIKEKDIKEIIELAKAKSIASSSKDVQTLQKELTDAVSKLKQYDEEVIPGIKKEVDSQRKAILIENELTKRLGSKKLRVAFEAAMPSLMTHLKESFDLDIDDKKQLALLQKGSTLKALKADKTGELTIDEIMDAKLKEWKFIEESQADKKDTKEIVITDKGGDNGGAGFAGAAKAQAALQKAKEMTEAATKKD